MDSKTLLKQWRLVAVAAVFALCTAAAGFAAPPSRQIGSPVVRNNGGQPAAAVASTPIDASYAAMQRLAEALHAVIVPQASGGLPKLRAYANAPQLAGEILGIAASLRDRSQLASASQSASNGPDDGRRGAVADLLVHYDAFIATVDRLETAQQAGDGNARFNAIVDLARLFDAEPKNRAVSKFNPASVRGQLANKQKVRAPLLKPAQFQSAGFAAATIGPGDPPTAADLAETDEVQLTPAIRAQAQALGNNALAIRNWVYNTIDFLPSYGSTQNSQRTLLAKRGNAFDTSSLLIALLRAANIPSRYVYGSVDLPVAKVTSWLNVPDAGSAADLLTASGIPTTVVTSGGAIQFLRIEHSWVEAYVSFGPSRGARNAAPDAWVAMDASFKTYTTLAALPVAAHVTFDPAAAQAAMLAGAQQGPNWITGINPNTVQAVDDQVTQQVASYVNAHMPADPATGLGKRSITPNTSPLLEGSLPYRISSSQTYRFAALPAGLQQTISVNMYDSAEDVDYDSPEFTTTLALAKLGTDSLQVQYAGASAADVSAMQQYVASNSTSLAAGSLQLVPQLKLAGVVLHQGGGVVYGTQQYWRVDVSDPLGAFASSPEASVFPAGTSIAFVVDTNGVTADYTAALTAGYPNTANLPMGDALALGGLQYFLLHDLFDDLVAGARNVTVAREPSVGAFATSLRVSYFFGVPRTGTTLGFVSDVKNLRFAVIAPSAEESLRALTSVGALGSYSEGATWSLLTGRDPAGALSAATLLLRANEAKIPIYQISADNVATDLPTLSLSDDDKNDIQNAVAAGEIVLVPAHEMRVGGWSGVGYLVEDPATGAGVWRVSGGLNGAIDVGCIAKAISLNVLCKLMFNKLLQKFIATLNPGALLAQLATKMLVLAIPVVGEILAVVQLALEIINITMEVLRWVRGIMNMIEELSSDDLSALGIADVNNFICSLGSPCFGSDFFSGIGNNFTPSGIGQGFSDNFLGGVLGGFGGGGPGEPAAGNPISVGNGIKWQAEHDYDGAGAYPLTFVRTFNSTQVNGSVVGNKWTHNYQSSIHVAPAPLESDATPSDAVDAVLVTRGDGTYAQYTRNGTGYSNESNLPEPIVRLADSNDNTTGWEVTRLSDELEHYDGTGVLLWTRNRAGLRHSFAYSGTGQLTGVSDDFGRSLSFGYDPASGQLATMTDPDGKLTSYSYDANGNASGVAYPDGTSRTYLYEDVMLLSYLTGIVDERGVRYATFAYDYRGRAVLSTHTGDAGKVTLTYGDNGTSVTDALGTTRTYNYTLINSRQYLTQVDEPCSAGCSAGGVSNQTFDGNGFVASRTDFNGNVTTLSHNARGLIENRTEAAATAQARSTTVQWHGTYHLPLQINEPLAGGGSRNDAFSYDASGNLTDLNVTAGSDARHWAFTYNAHGQVLTATNPRSDVSSTVTYTYDDATANLATMTDALGHQTRYTGYDAHGRLTRKIDPNGLISIYAYDPRGRLTSITEKTSTTDAGEVTQFGYDGIGALQRLTLPDGSYLAYTYDAAQRLTDIADSLGNSVHYSLDGLGNRTAEDTKDPAHVLKQTLSRVMDSLGRLKELHGARNDEVSQYTYDGVGNEASATDPLGHATSSTYDALNRLSQTGILGSSDPDHAQIGYGYDARDNLASITDPRNLVTSYTYSGFDELAALTSPDTGSTSYQYDADGNLRSHTDARNQRGLYAYDAGDRLSQIQFGAAGTGNTLASTEETLNFGYDEPAGGAGAIGRLTHADVAGTPLGLAHLAYQYDAHGRVTQKLQQLGANAALTTATHYNAAGQRDQQTLPSGAQIGYSYGSDGRTLTISVNGVTIVRDVAYFPFGDVASWTEGSSAGAPQYTRQYDSDGRVSSHRDGSVDRALAYDAASRITAQADSGVGSSADWSYGYDNQDRLISASNSATSGSTAGVNEGFHYDATGNRSSATNAGNTTSYTTDAHSNHLSSVGSAVRNYDAAGNTTDWTAPVGALHASYSARNRLSQVQSSVPLASYAYNAFGERIGKAGSGSQQFVYDDDGHLLGEYDASGKLIEETLWLDDTPVAVLKLKSGASNGGPGAAGGSTAWQGQGAGGVEVFWVESDQLDSPRAIVNATHQLIWHWDSDPFGTTLPDQAPSSGSGIATAFVYNLRFPGQYFDQETQTHYNYFRDYEPQTGRYLESDPIGLADGPNTFLYVADKPLSEYDPTGLIGVPKPGKGKGAVPKPQRDKKRVWTVCENQAKLAQQGGMCAQCGLPTPFTLARGHHIKRHADGGGTNDANHAVVCNPCHNQLHS